MATSTVFLRSGTLLSILITVTLVAWSYRRVGADSAAAAPPPPPQTYCYRGITTLDADQPAAQCFTVADGLFHQVTDAAQASELKKRHGHEDADPADGYVIPGLWDGHAHLVGYGEVLVQVDLFGADTLEQVRTLLKAYMKKHPEAGTKERWLRGMGWDQTNFGRMPTAADIDQDPELKGKYIYVDRIDGHCCLVSQAVLDLLPSPVPDVPGGEVVRDPGPGVFCDKALDELVRARYPRPGDDVRTQYVAAAMRGLNAVGLVGVHDAGNEPDTVRLLERLAGGADWTVRMYAMRMCTESNGFCQEPKIEREDGLLHVRSVKLYADGAMGSWGAAMLEPYSDDPSATGSLLINGTALADVTKRWAAAGFQVNIHAIGDLANRIAIDAFEAALRQECGADADLAACQDGRRFRLEHAQVLAPADQARVRALRIVPSVQPTHATSDMRYARARLGDARLGAAAYRMRSLLDARPLLGSDFPVEPPNPFHGMYAAVTRKSPATGRGPDGEEEGWYVEEALTLEEALWGFTGAAAYGGFMEGRAGQIRKGAYADWVVLDEPFGGEGFDVESLRTLKVRETWVAGKRVYKRED